MTNVIFSSVDYKGRTFDRFYARKSPQNGPGWFGFGRNAEYGDTLVRLCAQPDGPPTRGYRVHHKGWRTKKEAQAIADQLNSTFETPITESTT